MAAAPQRGRPRGTTLVLPEKALYFAIRRRPGQMFTGLCDTLAVSAGTLNRRLDALKQRGMVTVSYGPNYCAIAPVEPPIIAERLYGKLPPLGKPVPQEVYMTSACSGIFKYLKAHPGATQREIAAATNNSAQLVSYHIKQLTATGAITQHNITRGYRVKIKIIHAAVIRPTSK